MTEGSNGPQTPNDCKLPGDRKLQGTANSKGRQTPRNRRLQGDRKPLVTRTVVLDWGPVSEPFWTALKHNSGSCCLESPYRGLELILKWERTYTEVKRVFSEGLTPASLRPSFFDLFSERFITIPYYKGRLGFFYRQPVSIIGERAKGQVSLERS